jgi:2-polyprenyl-3-methyl-5-hydroxy-6-metoxy-1,4-benzoquinol methylase
VSEDFSERRTKARATLDAIDPHRQPGGAEADPKRRGWFEAVYALAEGDAAKVPWANLAPHPLLAEWLAANGPLAGLRALDVGCGLGDNALALAQAGARVTGFDLVESAIGWAQKRFPEAGVAFRVADLFEPPAEWLGAFDFVQETYTLQALPEALLSDAAAALARLVAPGGRLFVIARARDDAQRIAGPPWPLTRAQIGLLETGGLRMTRLEDIGAAETGRHWRALLSKE